MGEITGNQKKILLGAALYQSALLGVWINVTGVFLAAIRVELGLSMTSVSSYFTTKNVATALLGAIIAGQFFKRNKKFYMSFTILCVTVSALLLIGAGLPVLWYASAFLAVFAQSSSAIMVPYILNSCFEEKAGMATGIAMGASGLVSAGISPLASVLIGAFEWRSAIVALCVIMWIFAASGISLIFKYMPGGEDDAARERVMDRNRRKKTGMIRRGFNFPVFVPCSIIFVSATALMQFTQYFSVYALNVGYAITVGASLTSLNMIGNTLGKFLFGILEDVFGIWKTIFAAFVCILTACVFYMLFPGYLPLLRAGAFLYGIVYALVNMSLSRGSIAAYGAEESQGYVGLHISINNVGGAVYSMLIGLVYDATQNFTMLLGMGVFLCFFSLLSCCLLMGKQNC